VGCALDQSFLSLVVRPSLPPGWKLQSVTGPGSPVIDSGAIVFTSATSLPTSLNFAYTAAVPAGQTTPQTITNNVVYLLSGMTDGSNFLAAPNPLLVDYGSFQTVGQQGGQLGLTLYGDTSLIYNLQASADLVHWTNVGTLTPVGGVIQTNIPITGSNLFFQVESSR
jgi:hypothetical protein